MSTTPTHRPSARRIVAGLVLSAVLLGTVALDPASAGEPRPPKPPKGPFTAPGVGAFHVNQKGGFRWSAARAFLKPALKRPNLRLETGVLVETVLFEGKRAVGVRYRQGGRTGEAGEVLKHDGGEA